MVELLHQIKASLKYGIRYFAQSTSGIRLRDYQLAAAEAIINSVLYHLGDTIVVMFPRQSGKNELQAQVETYLLVMFSKLSAEMVKISPTWKPQTQNAMRRLERVLKRSIVVKHIGWKKESGYLFRVGDARIAFLSGGPHANVVGATANALLECDEAQDVECQKWDKDFAPMAASTNATRVFWGTAWTSKTLLARELRAAREQEKATGRRLAFTLTADDVRAEVPEYGKFVDGQIARLGRNHPMVRTQFFSEEIDSEAGMFPPARIAIMQGDHPCRFDPQPGFVYCLLLDVAGEDETGGDGISELSSPGRDSTALTVVEVDHSTLEDLLIRAPTYRVVNRQVWTGIKHTLLYGRLRALAEHWQARYLVVDATGVGAGISSFLDHAFPGKVIPFIFTSKSKSDLGWSFLAAIETGRYKEYSNLLGLLREPAPGIKQGWSAEQSRLQQILWDQLENCQYRIMEGPGKVMRWGVPDGTCDPVTGELVHDDLVLSSALVSVLDTQEWGLARSTVVKSIDPLEEMAGVY